MPESDEESLIEQAKRDPLAFAQLYDRYINRIYAFALRQTGDEALAKDVTSATFEKALHHIRRFRWRSVSFGAWLYRIARNEIAQHYRRRRWFVELSNFLRSDQEVESAVQRREESDTLIAALNRLSPSDRELITLRFLEELTSAEVAEVLGCSMPNLYLRLHRALKRLRQQLETATFRNEDTV